MTLILEQVHNKHGTSKKLNYQINNRKIELILKKDVEDETSNNQIIFGKQTFRHKNDVCFGTENENEEKGNEMKKIKK